MTNVSITALPVYILILARTQVGYVSGKGVVKLPSVTNSTRGNTILTDIKEAR
jgi:hypothetical protein